MANHSSFPDQFARELQEHEARFGLQLDAAEIARLREYYELLMRWNTRLHLVAPCSPKEFAIRHVLESLLAVEYMSDGAHVIDVGSGAGLPIIPCLIVRPDLRATLFESSKKKTVFLREALGQATAHERAKVIAERFEKREAPDALYVTCRALEQFTTMFQTLLDWSPKRSTLLLFGGAALLEEVEKSALAYQAVLIPESARRFLLIAKRGGRT